MSDSIPVHASSWCRFELEVPINASCERVFTALIEEINDWWLDDFRVVSADSKVTLNPKPGDSGLLESGSDGGALQWYTVQMYLPKDHKLYLVGFISPEFGGPMVSHLRLAVEATNDGAMLKILDSRQGNVKESHEQACRDGWRQLFSDGLKKHVEG